MEEWDFVPKLDNVYLVSTLGRIKNISTGRYLVGRVHKDGYKTVDTHKGYMFIHNMVTNTFLPHRSHPDGRRYVTDHINKIKEDNRLVNSQIISHRLNRLKDTDRFKDGTYCIEKRGSRYTLRIKNVIREVFDTLQQAQDRRTEVEIEMGDYFMSY